MNKSVDPREITTEAMLVDNQINHPTINPSSEDELSNPERPSGPSLEEQLSTHSEPKSEEPHDNQFINRGNLSNMDPASIVEDEASLTTVDIQTGLSKLERSDPAREERPVSLQSDDLNKSINKELICETRSSAQKVSAQSGINSEINKEQPSTTERSSDPSLEERSSQPNPSTILTNITGPCEQLSTPERSSDPTHEEQFQNPILPSTVVIGTDVDMADSEVAGLKTLEEIESLEDLTVYEVVTEYQDHPPTSTTNYSRVFLQLQDEQIIQCFGRPKTKSGLYHLLSLIPPIGN